MKVFLTFCLLALGCSSAEEASSTISSLEVSREIVDSSIETSTDIIKSSSEEELSTETTVKEETRLSSIITSSAIETESTASNTEALSVSDTTTSDFDEQNDEDVVQDDDDEENEDEDELDEHEDSKETQKTTEAADVNVNNPLALVGDNTTTTNTAVPALPRPPSFTAGSFFIGLLLGLVLLAVAYFGYVYYQRRKSLPAAGYRSYP